MSRGDLVLRRLCPEGILSEGIISEGIMSIYHVTCTSIRHTIRKKMFVDFIRNIEKKSFDFPCMF